MTVRPLRSFVLLASAFFLLFAGLLPAPLPAQSQSDSSASGQSSSSSTMEMYQQEKTPTLVDPAGPTISLVSLEPMFVMAAALNACGYDEGLDESAPLRKRVRAEINQALAKSEDARNARDKVCLFIAQHRMTGTERDISQYVSLALYTTPPPQTELTAQLSEMPPDSTAVAEIVPLLKDFADSVDLHGIWLAMRLTYDQEADQLHDALSRMIVNTNLYLKMPASTYSGRRFIVVFEPMLSPHLVNARIYGADFVVVVSPVNGQIRMNDVRHIYLHYIIEPLLYSRSNAIDRADPILKEIREAPLPFMYRSNILALTVECLIKAIEARIMDTGIPEYKIPAGIDRSDLPRYEHERQLYQDKVNAFRWSVVHHDMVQGYVLTEYFYREMLIFEKQPASLGDTIGEMVYSMDVDEEVHRARRIQFDTVSDVDVLERPVPRKLEGLDLAEARLSNGDAAGARSIAQRILDSHPDTLKGTADAARADFILARAAILSGQPEAAISDFQQTLATSKEPRLLAWSHIYLARMLDLDCKRDEAVAEYKLALAARDGQQDTRLAAERGLKKAYAVRGHVCDDDADDGPPPASDQPETAAPGTNRPTGSAAPAPPPHGAGTTP